MRQLFLAPFVITAVACASTAPSRELVDARHAYDQARASHASEYGPNRVLEAKQALDRAEAAHADDPGSFQEKRLAYVAHRDAQIAQAYGDFAYAKGNKDEAHKAYVAEQDRQRRAAEAEAARRGEQLEEARDQIATQKSSLATERAARTNAERRADAAVASLKKLAQVKEDERGTVITLDGSVLFLTGKSELLPLAKQKLDDVAKALGNLEDEQSITVEGYTDSRGSADNNQKLSEARAQAVRSYLVEKGVKADRIKAVGKGETDPVASNDNSEGRANNRRVEIVIGKQGTKSTTS